MNGNLTPVTMKTQDEKGSVLPQIFAIFVVTLNSFVSGALFTWPTEAIPALMKDDLMTIEEVSYFPVLPCVGVALAAPLCAYVAHMIGRRKAMLISAVPQFAAWICAGYGGSIYMYYASRILYGLVDAAYYTNVSAYVGELSTPKVRGTWGNLIAFLYYIGNLLIVVALQNMGIAKASYLFSAVPVAFFIGALFLPETPYWLLSKNRRQEALESLRWLRGKENVAEEFDKITQDVERQLSETSAIKDLFLNESNRKALIAGTFLRASQQFGGISSIGIYSQIIFSHGLQGISSADSTLIFYVLLVVTNIVAATLMDRLGRRPSYIISLLGCAFCLGVEAIYFYLETETDVDVSSVNLLPIVGLSLYVPFYAIGLGIMPSLMLGELFSASVKAKSLCVINIMYAIFVGGCTKLFQILMTEAGMYVAFAFFTVTTFTSTIAAYFIIPETSGKTLEEIQQDFKNNKT